MRKALIREGDYTPDKSDVSNRINAICRELKPEKFEEYDNAFGDRAILAILETIDLVAPHGWGSIPPERGIIAEVSDRDVFGINVQFSITDALEVAFNDFRDNWDDGDDGAKDWREDFIVRLDATAAAVKRIRAQLECMS